MIHTITLPTPFAVGDVHSYLVKGDTLTLFDVGPKTAEAREQLESQLKNLGYRPSDVEQVVLTHHHPDHSGWTELFENATLMGHAYNDVWFTRDEDFFLTTIPSICNNWLKKECRNLTITGLKRCAVR